MKQRKVKVSERAVLARVNRAMAKDYKAIRRCREDSRGFSTLGTYYHLNVYQNTIIDTNIDLEEFARKLGALKEYETLGE